jgi:hypothetical protein
MGCRAGDLASLLALIGFGQSSRDDDDILVTICQWKNFAIGMATSGLFAHTTKDAVPGDLRIWRDGVFQR